jgi:protein phosphatase 2C family protein 2/3
MCADFLKDYLHMFIIQDTYFPDNPELALKNGFLLAEKRYKTISVDESGDIIDRSGSCATIVLLVDGMCYVANLGDSRAIMSQNKGKQEVILTKDHNPMNEKDRIIKEGGRVYQYMFFNIGNIK